MGCKDLLIKKCQIPEFAKTHVPMKRYGREGELNSAVIFLSANESTYVTGVILPVDGGYTSV